jgi:hypothetical protein
MSLDKLLQLSQSGQADLLLDSGITAELALAGLTAVRQISVLLASGDSDSEGDGDDDGDGGSDHSSHSTYKALIAKKVDPKRAAAMCARSDKKVKAAALAQSAAVALAGLFEPEAQLVSLSAVDRLASLAAPPGESASDRRALASRGWALDDGTYPIPDKKHLHSAAVLAASKHGNWQAAKSLIRKRARDLGVDVASLPGFGSSQDGEKVAAAMLALARKDAGSGDGGIPMNHGSFTGTHTHSHFESSAHSHPHTHDNDSDHSGGPLHRPGSQRSSRW